MSRQIARSDAWGVLLAGGDGARLQPLTARIEGDTRPKQFCRVLRNESLMAQTRRRISPLFRAERFKTVVTRKHEAFYAQALGDMPETAVIVQPENRGTGVAIAWAALMILLERGPDALIAFFPCDHHYDNEAAFLNAVEEGILTARTNPEAIVLLGAEPSCPETDYGWVEPAQLIEGAGLAAVPVVRFREKPTLAEAQELMGRGCIWNTFVTIGRATTFIELLCAAVPNAILTMTAGIRSGDQKAAFRLMPDVDFSRDVLAAQPQRLLVIRDTKSGWTDLGNSRRVFDILARQSIAPSWLEAVRDVDVLTPG